MNSLETFYYQKNAKWSYLNFEKSEMLEIFVPPPMGKFITYINLTFDYAHKSRTSEWKGIHSISNKKIYCIRWNQRDPSLKNSPLLKNAEKNPVNKKNLIMIEVRKNDCLALSILWKTEIWAENS